MDRRPTSGGGRVADYMTRKVFTLRADKKLFVAKEIMDWAHIRHVPVLNEAGEPIGMVSHRDLLAASIASVGVKIAEAQRKQHLAIIPIDAVMRTPVTTIGPGAPVQEAAHLMRTNKIGCLLVVERGRLAGIITDHDLLRVVEDLPA